MKRLLALIGALAIAVSLLTVAALAVDPYVDYKMSSQAPLYKASTGSASYMNVPRGKRVTGTGSSNTGWSFTSSRTGAIYNQQSGYLGNQTIIPLYKSYVVSVNNAELTYSNNQTIPLAKYTYICKNSSSGSTSNVRAYVEGGTYLGSIPTSQISIDYGS